MPYVLSASICKTVNQGIYIYMSLRNIARIKRGEDRVNISTPSLMSLVAEGPSPCAEVDLNKAH